MQPSSYGSRSQAFPAPRPVVPTTQPTRGRERSASVLPPANYTRAADSLTPRRLPNPETHAEPPLHLEHGYYASQPPLHAYHAPFPPSSQSEREGREGSFSRPPSSLSGPTSEYGLGGFHPASASQALTDQYRPIRPGAINNSSSRQRGAAEVYAASQQPKAQKGTEILANLASLREWLGEAFQRREEDDREFRDGLSDRLKSLEDENRDLKERIHELSQGQKILPTKAELSEELTNQLSPALHEFFDSLHHTMRQSIEPLTNDIPKSTAEKIKLCLLELQDTARRDDMQSATGAASLYELMNHLIRALSPLHNIHEKLNGLSGLDEALHLIAVFQRSMDHFQQRQDDMSNPTRASPAGEETSVLVKLLQDLIPKIDEHIRSMSACLQHFKHDPKTLTHATGRLGDKFQSGINAHSAEAEASDALRARQPIAGLGRAGPAEPESISRIAALEAATATANLEQTIPATSVPIPIVNLIPPTCEQPIVRNTGSPPMNDAFWDRSALTTTHTGHTRPPIRARAPAALQDVVIDGDNDDDENGPNMSKFPLPAPPPRQPSFEINTTSRHTRRIAKAQQAPSFSEAAIDGPEKAVKHAKRKRATQITLAQAIAENSRSGSATSSSSDPPRLVMFGPRNTTAKAPEQQASSSVQDPFESLPPAAISDSLELSKRRKIADTVAVKQEMLNGAFRAPLPAVPTTRSAAAHAKDAGFDILSLENDVGESGRANSASTNNRKSSTASSRSKRVNGRGKQVRSPQAPLEPIADLLAQSQTQPQPQPQPHPQSARDQDTQVSQNGDTQLSAGPSQPALSRTTSTDLDFGHGQPLSVPSVPNFESTNEISQTVEYTQTHPTQPADTPVSQTRQPTSTDRVEQSASLALAPLPDTASPVPQVQTPRRADPSYRRYQIFGPKQAHANKMAIFGKSFLGMDSDDD